MKKPTRILIVEDKADDADLAKYEIRKSLSDCEFQVAETGEDFIEALETFQPDVILSDYTLPHFDGMKALKLTLHYAPLTPFIIWTGSISEDVAVECVKAGANNYILKENLKRLGSAVIHALEEKELLVTRKQAEKALQNSEKRFRALIENGLDDISLLAVDGSLLWESPSTIRNLGYAPGEFVGHNMFEIMHPEDLEWTRNTYEKLIKEPGNRQRGTFRLRRSDDTWRWMDAIATNMLHEPGVNAIVINYRDITEQKQAEIELRQRNDDLALINALNELINRGEELEAIVDLLRNELKHLFFAEYTNIYLLNQDGQSIKMSQYSLPPQVRGKLEKLIGRAIPAIEIPVQSEGLFQSVLRSGHGMVTSDPKVIQKWMGEFIETVSLSSMAKAAIRKFIPGIYEILNIKSTILVPLISDGGTLGLLNVSGSSILTDQDLKRIENLGGQLTTALRRRQVEDVLNEERNLLRTLIDNLPDRIYAMDMQGRKTLSNIADWKASGGKAMEDVIGKTDFDTYPRELAEEFWALDQAVLNSGQPIINYEEPGLDADGNFVSILTSKIPLRDDKGNVLGLVGIGRDITERKRTEERLRRSENQYRLATKATNDVIWEWDPKTNQLLWSENAPHVFGYPNEEIGPDEKWWDEHLHSDDRARVITKLDALISGNGSIWLEEYRFRLKDGSYAYIGDRGYIERDENGAPLRMIGAMSDITLRKEAEIERLALLEIMQGFANTKDLQELLKLIHGSIAKVIYAENFFVILYQPTSGFFEEIYSVDQYDPPAAPAKLENSITSYVFRSGEPLLLTQDSFEELATRGEMSLVGTESASWLGVPLKTSGRTIGVMAVQDYEEDDRYTEHDRDFLASIAAQVALAIERKQAEEALRESEEHYRTIFEGVQDAIFVESIDGRIMMANERACEMFGYSQAEFLTKTVADLVPPGDSILMVDGTETSLSPEPRETMNQRANGEVFPIEISGRIQVINGEKVLLVVVRDITERKRSETAEREQRGLAEALRDSAETLSSTLDYGEVLDHILAAVGRVVPHDAATIMLIEGESAHVVRSHGYDKHVFNAEMKEIKLPLSKTLNLQQMLETRKPVVVYDTHSYPGWQRMPTTDWLRSSVGAPISIYGEVIGFICLDASAPEFFTSVDAEHLEAFANQAALAIHNARLLQRAQEEIAERKRAEEMLRESEERFSSAFEHASIGMALLTTEGRWVRVNWALSWLLGYSEAELLQKTFQDITHPDDLETDLNFVRQLLSGEITSYQMEKRYFHKLGHVIWVLLSVSLVRDHEGKPLYFISQIQDVTEHKQAEDALHKSEALYRQAIEVAGAVPYYESYYDEGRLIKYEFIGEGIRQITGYGPEEFSATVWDSLVEETNLVEDLAGYSLDEGIQRVRTGENSIWKCEHRIRARDGKIHWVFEAAVELRDENGVSHGSIGTYQDITTRKQAEESLRAERKRAQDYLNIAGVIMLALDRDGKVTLINQKGCEILEYPADEVIGRNWNNTFLPEASRTEMQNVFQDLMSGNVQLTGYHENTVITKSGENRLIAWHNTLVRDEDGNIINTLSSGEDITERKRAEVELRVSEERFRQLADNIQEAFWMTDAENGREIYMSPAVETIWDRSIQSLMCEPDGFMTSVFSEDRPAVINAMEKEKNGEKVQLEYRIVRPDGTLRWIWDRAFPIFDESGKVKRIAGISADITERKEVAEQLRESEDRYHSLFQNQLHGSALHEIITNAQGQPVDYLFLKVNPAFEKMTGLKAEEIVGRRVMEVLPGMENEKLIQIYGQVALTGEPAHLSEYVAPLGRYYEINAYSTGHSRFAVSFMDVTERRQAEQELRKLSRAVEQSGSTIVITDTAGNIEYVNPKFTEITGYSYEEVIGQNPRILKSGLTEGREYAELWQTIAKGGDWHGELLNRKKNGELYWESVTISPIMNDRKEITHFVGVKEDITERKQNELEARRHIAELEAVYENGLSVGRLLEPGEIGNRVIETFARYLPWHHVTIRLRKEKSDDLELVSFNLPNLKEEERADTEQHFIARINKVGHGLSGWVIQTGMPLRTGNVHAHPQYIDTHAGIQSGLYMPLKVGDHVIGVISVESEVPSAFTEQDERLLATLANQTAVAFENARLYEAMQKELSERRRVEDALRISETHYRALANSITDILFELDQDLHYTHWNKASETLTGIPAEEAIGKSMEEIFGTTDEQAAIRKIYEDVLGSHQSRTFETILILAGEKRFFEINAYPSTRGVSVVAKDVTDRKRMETIMQKRFELMEYSAKHTLNELMQKTVDDVSELTGSQIGFFHFMDEDQVNLGMQTWSTNALQLFQAPADAGTHLPLDQAGVWADAVRLRRPLIQNDYESLAKKKSIPDGHVPTVREIVIPIIRNERIMAVMGIGNKPKEYTSLDLEIAARLADYAWDITERKQMEIALEIERHQLVERVEERTADLSRANSNLARALRVKDEFLANMSHELRTPLNAILGLSESLGEQIAGPLNEKQQKYISTISESGHHLLSLINDILDLAKIEAGQITLDINKVDIHSVCQASLRMVKQLAQKKNQDVSLEIDNGLGLMWADERRLKQMIVNLLGNAVKFTPEDGKLGLEVRGDEEANQIAITVWDNGIGIKQADLARLFQPFIQLDSGLAREATGTGLGLALVAQMARLHGGSVNAISDAGKGSRFTIILPWEPALTIDAASRMRITGKFRAIQFDDKNTPTILLVEDTKEVVMMLKDYLELAGYKVVTAQDGIDGLVQARHVRPDLILMDVQMPRMDGFETTRKLRSDPNFRYTPIIALTALAMPHDRERCLEAGMDEYISKPVNLKALIKIIQSCLFEQESRTR